MLGDVLLMIHLKGQTFSRELLDNLIICKKTVDLLGRKPPKSVKEEHELMHAMVVRLVRMEKGFETFFSGKLGFSTNRVVFPIFLVACWILGELLWGRCVFHFEVGLGGRKVGGGVTDSGLFWGERC